MDQFKNDAGRNITALILIGLGVFFLLAQVFSFSVLGTLWPFFIIGPGLVFLYYASTSDKSKAGLIFPGVIVTGTGAILLYQSITNHWESWAYIWALYPVFVGISLSFVGRRTSDRGTYRTGQAFIRWGTIGFIALWALFELFIFGGRSAVITTMVPVVLIAVGILLLFRGRETDKLKAEWAEKPKQPNNHRKTYSEELQEKIDEALADDETPTPDKP